ncbi:patatin-like phospholipase family protein [Thiolapillus sp.]
MKPNRSDNKALQFRRHTALSVFVLLTGVLAGCSTTLPRPAPSGSPAPTNANEHGAIGATRSNELLVILAFSGGGSRAAALSYGVLKKLRDTFITIDDSRHRLLDEVDYISSVSGGSLTSAYFGLFGERIFSDYEQDFLKRNVQAMLIRRILSPWNWPALWTAAYNRSELAARLYDEILFHGRTFSDLKRPGAPFIQISATNLTSGIPFTFDQHQFDLLCQDLSGFSVARAVAASAAVPLVLSPISLPNQHHSCNTRLEPWAEQALREGNKRSRAYHLALAEKSYEDDINRHWIHLVDGGVTDNIGMRPLLNLITRQGDAWRAMKSLGHGKVKKVIIIVVNAQTPVASDIGRHQSPPLTFGLNAAVTTALNAFSFETMDTLDSLMRTWDEEITLQRCWDLARRGKDQEGCFDIQHYIVDISFDEIDDPQQQERLKRIPTSFNLSEDEVDQLIEAGEALLQQSADFQRFLGDMR